MNIMQVQNQYMKVMLSYALNRKQTTKTFLVNNKKNHEKNNTLTVFEPKALLRCSYGTDTIPLNQSATFIIKCLDLKDSLICLDVAYFQLQNKTEKLHFWYLWVISLFFKLMH